MAVEVILTFDSLWAKQRLMREICDSMTESCDMRLEWAGAFDDACVFMVKRGTIADEPDEDPFADFDAGIFDEPCFDVVRGNNGAVRDG
jgi:hypothetical protein